MRRSPRSSTSARCRGSTRSARPALTKSIWSDVVATADQYNQPGIFTTFTGFEWTFTPQGDNLHRVVVFADGAEKTGTVVPFSFFDGPTPEKLWDYLALYEERTGGRAIAVPHNGNMSNGLMFSDRMFDGTPMTRTMPSSGSAGSRSTR